MIMNEHAWTCMRMYENDSCSREGWVILGWVALYDIHDNEWECTRMTENDWERLTSNENGWGCGHSMQIYILRHAWEWICTASHYPIIDEHVCDDAAWSCMRMYDIDSYSRGAWVVYGWVAFYDMHDECIRMTRIQGMRGSLKTDLHLTGRIIWHMLPSPTFTRMTTHRIFFS